MALSANDVAQKVFQMSFRGYKQDEVDDFLDIIEHELDERAREIHELRSRVRALEKKDDDFLL